MITTLTTTQLMDLSMKAAFPPGPLMQRVSGLTDHKDFAQHGRDIYSALESSDPAPLHGFKSILDFGVGCGRLARMFHDFGGAYTGVDVDGELVEWVNQALPWVKAVTSVAGKPLPFPDASFDCVMSVSVFTHMNETDSKFYLKELRRVTRPGAMLLLTVHGIRSIERALAEPRVLQMLAIPQSSVIEADLVLKDANRGFCFVPQASHLATASYDYGETFVSERYIEREWSAFFDVTRVVRGAIHDFQDVAVVRRQD